MKDWATRAMAVAVFAVAILSIAATLSGCGTSASSPRPPSTTPGVAASFAPITVDEENPSGRHTYWGAEQEIEEVSARVDHPREDTNASSKVEGRKIMVADLVLTNSNEEIKRWDIDEFAAYDHEGRKYRPSRVLGGVVSSHDLTWGESLSGVLAFDLPPDATVERFVWSRPVFEWINEWTWG